MYEEKIKGSIKDLSSTGKVKVLKVAKKVVQGTEKAVDGASDIAENISGKIGITVDSLKDKVGKKQENSEIKTDEIKKISLDKLLENTINDYNLAFTKMNDFGIRLYVERERALDLIMHIENLINSIANTPKSFGADIEEIHMYRENFQQACDFAKDELNIAKKTAFGAGSGVATGAAVASVAPTAAMWIATTFGTASTGTAISSLSGAAATNAALAWLGGGALAAGGGGMTAGTAFLSLAGPIGWGIAGVTIFASVALFTKNKIRTNKEKNDEIEKIKNNTASVNESSHKIKILYKKTEKLRMMLSKQYESCMEYYKKSFMDISNRNQIELCGLVNNTKSLAVTLGKTL